MQAKRKMPIGLAGLLTLGLIGVLCFHPAAAQAQSISETFSTSGSWKAPEGVTLIKVEAWGGGGGTGAPANNARRGGGGGGAYSEKAFCVTPGETYSFVVGTGGAATGGNGGDTYWVDPQTLIAKGGFGASGSSGGAGGAASDAEYISYGGGNGASSTGSASGGGGGGAGSCGAGINASGCTGGGATDEHGGKGGNGVDSEGRGKNGSNYGGGGGGSWRYGDTGNAGTTGACGLIRITYVLSALPKITAHPDSQAITYGENAEFSAAATGNPVPAVQWQLNKGDGWSDIPGETNATLKLIKPGVADSGSYRAVFRNTEGSAYSDTAALIVSKATAQVTLYGLNQTFDGSDKEAAADTYPGGLLVVFSYDGSPVVPMGAGTYAVTAKIVDDNYQGNATGDLVIKKADADIHVSGVTATYDGCAHGACGTAAGADGKDLSGLLSFGALFTDAPGGTANWHFAGDKNHNAASGIAEVIIKKADADIVLKNLRQTYDGQKKTVTAETNPAGLAVVFTYGGSETAPRSIGRYRVVGTAEDNNYQGSVTGTLIIFDETATTFTLSVSVIGQGTTGLRTGVYEEGDVILLNALSAVPAEGFEFVGWQDVKGHMLKSVTISADTEIFAVFSKVIDVIPIEDIPAVANTGVKGAVSKGTVPASKPWPAAADASDGWLWWLLLAVPFGLGLWLLLFLAIKRKGSSIGIET